MSILNIASTTVADSASGNLWSSVNGSAGMNIVDALKVSVVGFAIVFAVLGFLAIFVYCMGRFFDLFQTKKEKKASEVVSLSDEEKSAGYPLPENSSMGDLTLINTTEEEAAVIMAITSDMSKIPLNRLKFNSIKLLEDDKK